MCNPVKINKLNMHQMNMDNLYTLSKYICDQAIIVGENIKTSNTIFYKTKKQFIFKTNQLKIKKLTYFDIR